MFRNQEVPLNLHVVFENTSASFWTSNALTPNHYVIQTPVNWFLSMANFLKKDVFFCQSFLVEHSIIDTRDYWPKNIDITNFLSKNSFLSYYTFYFYFLKLKLTFFIVSNNFFYSIDSVYSNANWLERESSEMYGCFFYCKKDTRKLLLDYSKQEAPMCKDIGTEGNVDYFYSFFDSQVIFQNSEVVEL